MGGRGTFAAGNPVPYTYKKVGEIEGVKVLEGTGSNHGLPASSHSSEAYIKLKPDGTFHEIRFYDKNHILYLEIAYHPESSLTGNNEIPVLHYHTYDPSFSLTKEGNGGRSKAQYLTREMIERYKKFFKKVQI